MSAIAHFHLSRQSESVHRLKNVNLSDKIADCAECGPTRIYTNNRGDGRIQPQCVVSAGRPTPKLDPSHHRLTEINDVSLRGTCSICGPNTRILERWHKPTKAMTRVCWAKTRLKQAQYESGKRGWAAPATTALELAALEREQGGQCAICPRGENLHLDHCHTTGKVRGFLCQRHNMGIGLLDDDPAILRAAAVYLEA